MRFRIFNREASKYRSFFAAFLISEIPNFFQIFTLILIANAYVQDLIFRIIFALLVASLATAYFGEKFFKYSWSSLNDKLSSFNMEKLDPKEFLKPKYAWWYSISTVVIFYLISVLLAFLTPLF